MLVLGDFQPGVERLVREPAVAVVGACVGAVCVSQQPRESWRNAHTPLWLSIVLGEALLDVSEPRADAVLVPLQRRQVDGIGEVCPKEFVALGFEPGSVDGEIGELLIPSGALLIKRSVDFGSKVPVVVLTDRDVAVGVLDQPFGDLHGHGAADAGGLLRGAAGADEVGVGGAAWVRCEVQQHPRPATAAVQQPFEVVRVLDVPRHPGVARLQQRLDLIEQHRANERLVRARMQGALVADHSGVVRVRQHRVERSGFDGRFDEGTVVNP